MSGNTTAMVLASFVGDSLSLGVHWIYDQARLAREYGRVRDLLAPGPGSYHPTKTAGQFTHYGDQTLVLLESLAATGAFSLEDFSARWRALFDGYGGYVDKASRATLERLAEGWEPQDAGSGSNDLAGAARIAPLAYRYRSDPETLVGAARAQTAMTHRTATVLDAAEFFARTVLAVLDGEEPAQAMRRALRDRFPGSPLHGWVAQGLEAGAENSVEAIARFGQSCHVEGALTGVVQLVVRHPDGLEQALEDSALAGGDSAARNLLVGMVLGARLGMRAIPERWLTALKAREKIEGLLDRLPVT